jgi:hypothetical protein
VLDDDARLVAHVARLWKAEEEPCRSLYASARHKLPWLTGNDEDWPQSALPLRRRPEIQALLRQSCRHANAAAGVT